MSKKTHLYCRHNLYYYRIKVPTDLKQHIPSREIKKSLKTTDQKIATTLAVSVEYEVHKVFALLRSNLLPEDMVPKVVNKLLGRPDATKDTGVSLGQAICHYIALNESKWSIKTKMENESSFKLLMDVITDIPLRRLTRQTVLDCRDVLCRLPGNMPKFYKGLTVRQVLEKKDIVPMSVSTVNKHLTRLSSLLKYSVAEGHMKCNYAEGVEVAQSRRVSEERKTYALEDLRRIVTNLPRDEDKPERYWIPLIGMYSGMRLDEICQLHIEDIQQVDEVWCFRINDEQDKKLKTQSSNRIVPLHPNLMRLGLREYHEQMKVKEHPRLWMNLKRREADGYGSAFGKWFQRFNREHVTTDKAKVFHSLRHTVTDTLKQAGIQEVLISEIMGHANDSMTMSRYGKRYQPRVLLEALMHLDYRVEIPGWE